MSAVNNEDLLLPRIFLTRRKLCDLELILNGGFSPLKGFLNEDDYLSVLSKMRLVDGTLWPIPITLDVPTDNYKIGQKVLLCDFSEKPLASLTVESVYKIDKSKEAKSVYKTQDKDHFGVRYLFEKVNDYCLGGKVERIRDIEHLDFKKYRLTPEQLKKRFKKNGWKRVVAFQTRNPIHQAHFWMIKNASESLKAKVLIHPSVGETKDGDIDYLTRVKCYEAICKKYAKDFSMLSLLPLAMRMAGPREAVLHAIVRKNYGATDFIVGRSHADPGNDKNGKPFYDPFDAQRLALKYGPEIGINIVSFQEMAYSVKKKKYVEISEKNRKSRDIKRISGTVFREMIKRDRRIPEWFSFPEVIKILKKRVKKQTGFVVFVTGLPCSGKSTIASHLASILEERFNRNVTLLDGDVVRKHLSRGLTFSLEDRKENIRRIGFVANEIVKHGGIVVTAAIAPNEDVRKEVRSLVSQNGSFVEVYLSTPIATCKKRDIKGLYKKAGLGIIKNVTGVDDKYERPKDSEIEIDTTYKSVEVSVDLILNYLKNEDLLKSSPVSHLP